MAKYVLYCRAGFENDCAAEIQTKAAEVELYGFCRTKPDTGYVEFEITGASEGVLFAKLQLDSLIFCRQWFCVIDELFAIDIADRISPIMQSLKGKPFSDFTVDYPDTNLGKEVSGFAKKFSVPLRNALRKQNILVTKSSEILHLFVFDSQNMLLGWSPLNNRSELHLGIKRLKFPSQAPSRSTLKLEEAFHHFIPAKEWDTRLSGGLLAVDLGAAPGGWTWQLVNRGMMVSAIDNGPMNERLMDSGQVKHFKEDGFKFSPYKRNVYWLVCDMVEKPKKVSALMVKWIINGWCKEAIFNLKLPMKQRFQTVQEIIEDIEVSMYQAGKRYQFSAKHLYHDREEITCHLRAL
ncbi:23S rRNA (cytidine(2498)-2'-O)-methyltransferase RlmM [Catenovulum sediminis]|uniref:Ribosomal RNA large subunit methyltransferase M n=1 Tax=Catenovulum sediminis TaxID=1740262 RepID=A0ABV1RLB2_9ALTE|nr:23S rRNA (cytidine(2498)-2'-O)-methyltransferase RlmM [Catenovulum sediminis]